MELVSITPVRANSKGLPGKNIRILGDKPLYRHAVDQGLRFAPRCLVSTDIPEILESRNLPDQCEVLERPGDLCGDDIDMEKVVLNLIDACALESEIIILLQATSPLRADADIRRALQLYQSNRFDLVMSVTEADKGLLKYGMVEDDEFLPVTKPEFCFTNRQKLPAVYKPNGAVYVFEASWFRKNEGFVSDKIGIIEMPQDRSHDIDSIEDFKKAEVWIGSGRGT